MYYVSSLEIIRALLSRDPVSISSFFLELLLNLRRISFTEVFPIPATFWSVLSDKFLREKDHTRFVRSVVQVNPAGILRWSTGNRAAVR
jgi:hypothetical protein